MDRSKSDGRKYGTALMAAASHGHLNLVQMLLDHEADVNIRGGLCGTTLHVAVVMGRQVWQPYCWNMVRRWMREGRAVVLHCK